MRRPCWFRQQARPQTHRPAREKPCSAGPLPSPGHSACHSCGCGVTLPFLSRKFLSTGRTQPGVRHACERMYVELLGGPEAVHIITFIRAFKHSYTTRSTLLHNGVAHSSSKLSCATMSIIRKSLLSTLSTLSMRCALRCAARLACDRNSTFSSRTALPCSEGTQRKARQEKNPSVVR